MSNLRKQRSPPTRDRFILAQELVELLSRISLSSSMILGLDRLRPVREMVLDKVAVRNAYAGLVAQDLQRRS